MEFWGVEVKSGEPLMVEPGEDMVVHLSQASLGEAKKDKGHESISLHVNVDGKKLVLAHLCVGKLPQHSFDLIFDRNFELSHNWKNGSVFFCGYTAKNPVEEYESESGSEFDSEEDNPLLAANNGLPSTEVKPAKPAAAEKENAVKVSEAGKQKVKIVEPNENVKTGDDEDSSDDSDDGDSSDESGDEDSSDDEPAMRAMVDSDSEDGDEDSDDSEDDEDSDEEDEETPKKIKSGKKRAAESAMKTPVPDKKKAKLVTSQKKDGKKGSGHVATPHPSKKAGKTTKSNQPTPKSEGSYSCKPCNRSFKSDAALDSHNKAKHSSGK